MFAQLILKLLDLVNMSDPSILAYERPIYQDELDDLGDLYYDQYKMHMGV